MTFENHQIVTALRLELGADWHLTHWVIVVIIVERASAVVES